jgi:HSP20 family protein
MRRLSEDMDRVFQNFLGRDLAIGGNWPETFASSTAWPELEVFQKDNKLVVQADVPGIKKEDVKVEVKDGELCISGERRSESEREEGGVYRSERSYGSFRRIVPLPEGAKPDTATASFENGVLRVEVEAPAETSQRRRVEVK